MVNQITSPLNPQNKVDPSSFALTPKLIVLSLAGYGGKHPEQTVEVTHEEKKKNWFDLDDDRKKQIEVCCLS